MNADVQKLGDTIETILKTRTMPGLGLTAHQLARAIWEEALTNPGEYVLDDIRAERARQNAKWGEQNHSDGTGPDIAYDGIFRSPFADLASIIRAQVDVDARRGDSSWTMILLEEVFEALSEDTPARLRTELVQVAAVAAQWVEAIDRRPR